MSRSIMAGRRMSLVAVALCGGLVLACTGGEADPEPPEADVEEPNDVRGERGKLRRGKVPIGRGRIGKIGPGQGPGPLRMALSNGSTLERTEDGTLHAVWVDRGDLVYGRYGSDGTEDREVLAEEVRPTAVLDTDGEQGVVVVWTAAAGGLLAASSVDGGDSFTAPSRLTDVRVDAPAVRAWRSGGVMGRRTLAMVAWHEQEGGEASELYYSTLDKGGWSEAESLNAEDASAGFPSLGGSGSQTWLAWRDRDRTEEEGRVLVQHWGGAGEGWEDPVLERDGMDPSICATASGWIHLAYHDAREVYYLRSTNAGTTWSAPKRLGPGQFAHVDCNEAGQVAVAWEWSDGGSPRRRMGRRDVNKTVGLARSVDGGNHLSSRQAVDKEGLIYSTVEVSPEGALDLMYVDRELDAVKIKHLDWTDE